MVRRAFWILFWAALAGVSTLLAWQLAELENSIRALG